MRRGDTLGTLTAVQEVHRAGQGIVQLGELVFEQHGNRKRVRRLMAGRSDATQIQHADARQATSKQATTRHTR